MLRFWELHPEKRPAVIYIPYYEFMTVSFFDRLIVKGLFSAGGSARTQSLNGRLFYEKAEKRQQAERFKEIFDCEITQGEAGYILYVIS